MQNEKCDLENRLEVPVTEEDGDICRVLWLSVIMQALSDALSTSHRYPFKGRREKALEWFAAKEGTDSDFAIVCDLAGVDFEMAKQRINKFLSGQLPAIDFRCFRKGNLDTPPTESRNKFFKRIQQKELRGRIRRPISVISPEHFRQLPLIEKPVNDNTDSHRAEAA